jgi:hypothetical protein
MIWVIGPEIDFWAVVDQNRTRPLAWTIAAEKWLERKKPLAIPAPGKALPDFPRI